MDKRVKDLTGHRFGRLLVVEFVESRRTPRGASFTFWECRCDCGNTIVTRNMSLRTGHTKSCGCFHKDRVTTHGMTNSRTFQAWHSMKRRCRPDQNSENPYFLHYYARGIRVCDRWMKSFENFYTDMGECPEDMSLDRIDNNGNYEPGNCRWATVLEQNNNRQDTLPPITFEGKTQSIVLWAKELGIKIGTLRARINDRGWPAEKALATPVGKYHRG